IPLQSHQALPAQFSFQMVTPHSKPVFANLHWLPLLNPNRGWFLPQTMNRLGPKPFSTRRIESRYENLLMHLDIHRLPSPERPAWSYFDLDHPLTPGLQKALNAPEEF